MPTLAVAEALRAKLPGVELLYIGSMRAEDRQLVESAHIEFRAIHAGKLRRYLSWENVVDSFRFLQGIREARRILRTFGPQVVFAKGGFVSLPVVMAAKQLDIPVVVHESDSQLGLANKLALRSAKKLAVAWPVQTYWQTEPSLGRYADKFIYTGLPIVKELTNWRAGQLFNNDRPVLLVTGGSQGARSLNEVVWGVLPRLLRECNLVHQVGSLGIAEAETRKADLSPELQSSYLPFEFDRNVFLSALHRADLVISRSGSFVFELAALGKVAILVPLPGSANDHQRRNAIALSRDGAAVMLSPELLNGEMLVQTVKDLIIDKEARQAMTEKIKVLGEQSLEAASIIAKLIIDVASQSQIT